MRVKRLRVIVIIIVSLLVSSMLFSIIVGYGARNYDLLGTNRALGSIILDPNFVSDDWNKWEMITWGIFLSNFPIPLIDDYESAFSSSSTTGSRGSGYKALQFGSGSDPANKENINSLLSYAITQQKHGELTPIYVTFSEVKRDGIERYNPNEGSEGINVNENIDSNIDIEETDEDESIEDSTSVNVENSNKDIRQANFKDLFIMSSSDDGYTWIKLEDFKGIDNRTAKIVPIEGYSTYETVGDRLFNNDRYISIATINEGSLPTFYIKYGSGYEVIFDYTDGWDIQLLTAWIARVACGEYSKEFKEIFNDMWDKGDDLKLYLDSFGNIVVVYSGDRRIVIPAAANQHLTDTPKINLINSMIFNGYIGNISGTDLALIGQQSVSGWFGWLDNFLGIDLTDVRFGGLPALGSHISSVPQGLILMYYDLDTIMYQTYFKGGYAANGEKGVVEEIRGLTERAYNVHYGKAVEELFNLDITKEVGNEYLFKIEAANMGKFDFSGFGDGKAGEALSNMLNVSGQIANIVGRNTEAKILTKVLMGNGEQNLFDSPVIIPVQMDAGRSGSKINSTGVARLYINYLYEAYRNGKYTLTGNIDSNYVKSILNKENSNTMRGFKENILGLKDGILNPILSGFIADNNALYKLNIYSDELYNKEFSGNNPFKDLGDWVEVLYDTRGNLDYFPGRLIKAYPVSEVMRAVSNTLGVREGTEFALFSPYIYMTYLDWYGVDFNKLTGEPVSNFNKKVFDGSEDILNVDIENIVKTKSEEDKKKDILNYTYMLLHPTEGKEYRDNIRKSFLSGFIYDNYQKIVYGNSTSYYSSVFDDLATRSSQGFLNISPYSENFMTSWFIERYADIAIVLIAISFILIMITGILKRRKVSWFMLALTVVINTILIVPSAGEITPAVANNYVQNMFSDKMTYWAVAESVANANLESKYLDDSVENSYLSNLNMQDRAQVVNLIKTMNIVYLDRALMIKSDISRKVTQASIGNYEKVQTLKSARWLLPIIMRQFTANDKSPNYVYLPLGDMYDDLSNMYWFYNPEDAIYSNTINGSQYLVNNDIVNEGLGLSLADRKMYFSDYTDTTLDDNDELIPYRSEAYYRTDLDNMTHTYFYILKSDAKPLPRISGFDMENNFKQYIENSITNGKDKEFLSAAIKLEKEAGTYDRFNRNTIKQSYGYLWATENPYHYFYQVIKDSFDFDISLGALVGKLQGQYIENDLGEEVRVSFMHAGNTGYVRDILDLEELFTNVIPYLYQMQITAGGTNGTNGVLGDSKIEEYEIYKNNYKSWLFRSNWVTKIMESPELSRPTIVKDSNGNKIRIENPVLIDSYPKERPMIFSEAQMKALGLEKSDLSLAELKCVEVNKKVSMNWTYLLNYINLSGMTKEVLFRQMATEAILEFNREFSPSGMFNAKYAMYPNGIDLRAISFDSVIKMLMLNITKDTRYIYGDTMKNLIESYDMFTAILLLSTAFLCSYLIPLVRNIVMGLIFYLGFVAILYSLLEDNKHKLKLSLGYLISNIIILVLTLTYYGVFSGLMAITAPDSVLTMNSIEINTGNPVWCIIIILVVSILYIVAMFKMIDFCFKHYRDMGIEVYTSVVGLVANKIYDGVSKLGNKLFDTNNDNTKINDNTVEADIDVKVKDIDDKDKDNDNDNDNEDIDDSVYNQSGYNYDDDYDLDSDIDIDGEIEKGKNLGDE